jgi:hypothetical protein
VRSGNANRRVGVSGIFHSKRLNNDGQRSASSRLRSGGNWKVLLVNCHVGRAGRLKILRAYGSPRPG